jgi:hypothetical protein
MADDKTNPNEPLEPEELDNPTPDAPEEPETPNEEPEDTPEVVEEDEGEPDGSEKPQEPSRREQLRIQQVLSKLKQQPQQEFKPKGGMNYADALDADPQIIKQLEEDRDRVTNQAYSEAVKMAQTSEWRTMLHIDAPQVESKYPQLNRESDDFNPAVSNAISQWYLATVGYDPETETVQNPNVRYSEFAEGIMELAEQAGIAKAAKSSKNIASQVAHTGLRPDGTSPKALNLNKDPGQMSDDELDAVLNNAFKK